MSRVVIAIFMACLVIVACGKVATVQVEGCKTDADCASTSLDDECCNRCAIIVGTKQSIDARTESCKGKSGSSRCPTVDCRQLIPTPTCTAGRCVGVTKQPEPAQSAQ